VALHRGLLHAAAVDVVLDLAAGGVPAGSLTSSDVPHEAPTLSTHVDPAGNVLSVLFGPATPSYLYLETFSAGWV
jgi:hypothetical protein